MGQVLSAECVVDMLSGSFKKEAPFCRGVFVAVDSVALVGCVTLVTVLSCGWPVDKGTARLRRTPIRLDGAPVPCIASYSPT